MRILRKRWRKYRLNKEFEIYTWEKGIRKEFIVIFGRSIGEIKINEKINQCRNRGWYQRNLGIDNSSFRKACAIGGKKEQN